MTDDEIKEDCLMKAGIDLGRYSYTEMTQIKDALRRYTQAKLKLLTIPVVAVPKGTLCKECGADVHGEPWYICRGCEEVQ